MPKRIGSNILEKKSYSLLPPKEQKNFEKFLRSASKQSKEEQEETLTSPMPEEPEPSSDKLADDRVQLYKEKNTFSNNHEKIEEEECNTEEENPVVMKKKMLK